MTAATTDNTTTEAPAPAADDFDFNDWMQRHGRTATIAGIVLLVLAAATWLFIASGRRKEAFAAADLARARATAESGNLPLAANDLSRLAERFSGTRAGDEAAVLLNQIRLLQGQRDVAVTALQEFVRSGANDDAKASGYGLLGAGLEEQGKFREAAEAYRQAAHLAKVDFLRAGYLLEAGRTFALAGDSAAARTAYSDVLTRYDSLDQAAEARVRLAEIGGQIPDNTKQN